jgi:putative hydrolase of the HAD superfamily
MGGVVARDVATISIIAPHFGISKEDFFLGAGSDPKATHTNPYHLGDVGAIMRGELSSESFWDNFLGRTGIAVSGDPWYDFFHPILDEDVVNTIVRLKGKGHRVVCGTNVLDAHYRKHSERGDYSVFDVVYASHIMGIIKPDPAFWTYILEREKVSPEEAFFVDDLEENIRAAEKLGLKTHLFTGAAGLSAALGPD